MKERSAFAYWSFRFAVLAAVIAILTVGSYRLEVMEFRLAFLGLVAGTLVGLLAALSGIAGIVVSLRGNKSGKIEAWTGLLLGLMVAAPVLFFVYMGSKVPHIHDITTDLQNPPQFVAIRSLRTSAHNPLDRENPPNLALLQQTGYPDLGPVLIQSEPQQVFEKALALVQSRGWDVIAASAEKGVIEATATTPIMGFKDDVVIRVREEGVNTRVDMRSVSRIGQSDLGANAMRIKAFLTDLRNAE